MQPSRSLGALTTAAGLHRERFVADASDRLVLEAPGQRTDLGAFYGRSVLISANRQLPAVQALLALDGVARRLVLCPPDLHPDHLAAVIAEAEVEMVVSDGSGPGVAAPLPIEPIPTPSLVESDVPTEWLLMTSGTTGRPKLVVHSLASLAGPLEEGPATTGLVWSTFYDVRRYGGLQILLRALLGGGSLVLSQMGEATGAFLRRAADAGVTHLLGTPSHWRATLMNVEATAIAPRYVRLSGEIADQAILDALVVMYPNARVVHAFASTEAGVGFEVTDGRAGFPAAVVGAATGKTEIRVVDGSLRLRSTRTANRVLGGHTAIADDEGFVDTGDIVERRGDRYVFTGRREGVINVGGQKVYPEEVEAVIAAHPAVQIVRVYPRKNPITGSIAAAELVLHPQARSFELVRAEVLQLCRDVLAPHKVPASVYQVDSIAVAPTGKIVRPRA